MEPIANTLLADALKPECDVKGDNLSLVFPKSTSLDEIAKHPDVAKRLARLLAKYRTADHSR